jgi:hypothetical protein
LCKSDDTALIDINNGVLSTEKKTLEPTRYGVEWGVRKLVDVVIEKSVP